MNPNETNPSSPTGASGAMSGSTPTSTPSTSSVPSPVDFTNPNSLNTNTSSLSMADSLASAQDNLTSAGQAANTGVSTAMGLGEIGASSASATMDRPGEALTPADPVPGSIGSVTSVPPLAQEPMDMGALGSNSTTAPAANSSFGATPTATGAFGATASTPATTTPATASSFGTTAAATDTANTLNTAAPSKPVQPYYNPFARTMGANTTATSSTNVPPALQPQTEKFSSRMNAGSEKKKPNIMLLLGWLLTALFAVTTVVFLMLWMDAKNNPQIIYRDQPTTTPDEPVADTVSLMTCTQDFGNPIVEGLENLTGDRKEVSLRFVNGNLNKVDLSNVYTFTDDAAAEAARGYFDGQNTWYNDIAANVGVTAITANLNIEGNTARQDLSATAESLAGDYVGVFSLTTDEAGNVDLTEEGIRQSYTNGGFICTAE